MSHHRNPIRDLSRRQTPTPRPALPAPIVDQGKGQAPAPPPSPDRLVTVSTKLDQPRLAKLDRIARKLGLVKVGRSAALRWVLDQHKES
jgi:hypothetical protein